METFFMFIAFILSIFALITASRTVSQLNVRIDKLEKQIRTLYDALSKLNSEKHRESNSAIEYKVDESTIQRESSVKEEHTIPLENHKNETPEIIDERISYTQDTFSAIPKSELSAENSTTSEDSSVHTKPPRKRTSLELESLIGGKYLNRIGAFAMILAVGFFLKFAFENNWINEWTRVSMGAVFGVGMIILAGYLHKKDYSIFSQGLVAIGVSSLYLSVFAAYNFYQLLPQIPAFTLMVIVTVVAFLQAIKFNSLAAAMLATIGGFITPFLLPTAHPNEIGLFAYIALLDVGILVMVVAKERWSTLEYLSLFSTYLVYLLWYSYDYNRDTDFAITLFHLTVFWGIFFSFEVYKISNQKSKFQEMYVVASCANLLAYYGGLFTILNSSYYSDAKGWVTFLVGAVYFGTFLILNKRGKVNETIRKQYLFISIALLLIATSIEYKNYTAVVLYSIEALGLFWCSIRWKYVFIRNFSLVIFVFAFMQILSCIDHSEFLQYQQFQVLFNKRALGIWTFIISLAFASIYSKRIENEKSSTLLKSVFTYSSIAVLFCWLTVETNDYFLKFINYSAVYDSRVWPEYFRKISFGYVWGAYGLLLLSGAFIRKHREVLIAGIIVSFVAFIGVLLLCAEFNPIRDHILLLNIRVGLIVYLIVIFGIQYKIFNSQNVFLEKVTYWEYYRIFLKISVLLLIFELVTVETYSFFEKQIALCSFQNDVNPSSGFMSNINEIQNKQQLSLSVIWLAYSIVMMIVGFARKIRGLRISSIVLSGFVILKVFLYDLSFLTLLYRIISFFGLGMILLLTSYFYQRYKHYIVGEDGGEAD